MQNYLQELNEAQQEAVKFIDGPSLIIAGAGSGKTRVLTYKIVHLIQTGFNPNSILALTFTNKAAREMQERMKTLVDVDSVRKLWMGTFHSIFAKILRKESSVLGFPSTFSIYDADDSKKEINEIVKELKLDPAQYPANQVFGRISMAKNNLILPPSYETNIDIQKQDMVAKQPENAKIYKMYYQRCRRAGAMDFDDLLLNTNILFRDFPEIAEKYQKLFKFILVDEYQDTNYSQYLIIKKLSAFHRKICVVGDDSQSIYSFRGAKIENILNFKNDFSEYELFKLEQNYRSTQHIVNAANSLIEKNKNRIPKIVFTDNEAGSKIQIKELPSDRKESYFVAKNIVKTKRENEYSFFDFAILYRTNAQSRVFEDALRKSSIPYKIFGSISFYQRSEIKDIVAYLRLLINKRDDQAVKRIINYPRRGIGNTTIQKIVDVANSNNLNVWDVLIQIEKLNKLLNNRAITTVRSFVSLIELLTKEAQELDAIGLVNSVIEKTGIKKLMSEDRSPEGVGKFDNVQEFINAVQEFSEKDDENVTIENFLEEIALATDQDSDKENTDRVSLMTIHASKGLEYKNVYIVGVEEGLFPSFRSITSPKDIEEERRLFYVAITRSEKELYICHAKQRMKWGQYNTSSPSRFISEIDPKFVEFEIDEDYSEQMFDINQDYNKFALKNNSSSQLTPKIFVDKPKNLKSVDKHLKNGKKNLKDKDDNSGLAVGMKVNHAKFGDGEIIQIEGDDPNTKALVDFAGVGQKNLLLKFAKLTIIE
ncbi:MAG: UvrD-helicase domain-containing protein [Bacteroidales bacterium]|nr:UvrD-helicase domain-containing protein [Bacteroidales bacterium]